MDVEGTSRSELAEMARLADQLVEQIGAARRHYDELRAALDGAGDMPASDERRALDEAHLLALSMAVTGVSRDEALRRLNEAFVIDDPQALLDEAYGVRFDEQHEARTRRSRFGRGRRARRREAA